MGIKRSNALGEPPPLLDLGAWAAVKEALRQLAGAVRDPVYTHPAYIHASIPMRGLIITRHSTLAIRQCVPLRGVHT